MESEEYLKSILSSQTIASNSDEMESLRNSRDEVEELLVEAFVDCDPTIRYAGSKAKGTMIKESYDLDVVCYFKHDDTNAGESLKDIYENVFAFLSESYYVERKNSAIRVMSKDKQLDYHIDVVPGRFDDDLETDANLYQADGDKDWLKTNLDTHIAHIKDSGLTDVIRLIKLWKVKTGLSIRTFVLELMVVKYAKKMTDNPLSVGLESFWQYLKDNGNSISVEDPANPEGNDLSPFLTDSTKQLLSYNAEAALSSIKEGNWPSIFGEAKKMFGERKVKALEEYAAANPSIPKPWSY